MEDTESTARERTRGKDGNQEPEANTVLMSSKPLHRFISGDPKSLGVTSYTTKKIWLWRCMYKGIQNRNRSSRVGIQERTQVTYFTIVFTLVPLSISSCPLLPRLLSWSLAVQSSWWDFSWPKTNLKTLLWSTSPSGRGLWYWAFKWFAVKCRSGKRCCNVSLERLYFHWYISQVEVKVPILENTQVKE